MEVGAPALELPGCSFGKQIHQMSLAHSDSSVHVQSPGAVYILTFMLVTLVRFSNAGDSRPPTNSGTFARTTILRVGGCCACEAGAFLPWARGTGSCNIVNHCQVAGFRSSRVNHHQLLKNLLYQCHCFGLTWVGSQFPRGEACLVQSTRSCAARRCPAAGRESPALNTPSYSSFTWLVCVIIPQHGQCVRNSSMTVHRTLCNGCVQMRTLCGLEPQQLP